MADGEAHAGATAAAQQSIEAAEVENLRCPQHHPAFTDLGARQPDLLRGDRAGWAEQ